LTEKYREWYKKTLRDLGKRKAEKKRQEIKLMNAYVSQKRNSWYQKRYLQV
jgi:hypothetical protein